MLQKFYGVFKGFLQQYQPPSRCISRFGPCAGVLPTSHQSIAAEYMPHKTLFQPTPVTAESFIAREAPENSNRACYSAYFDLASALLAANTMLSCRQAFFVAFAFSVSVVQTSVLAPNYAISKAIAPTPRPLSYQQHLFTVQRRA